MQRQTKNNDDMNISILSPQSLIEQTHNFYGLKADLAAAIEFIEKQVVPTPGSFYDWMMTQQMSRR